MSISAIAGRAHADQATKATGGTTACPWRLFREKHRLSWALRPLCSSQIPWKEHVGGLGQRTCPGEVLGIARRLTSFRFLGQSTGQHGTVTVSSCENTGFRFPISRSATGRPRSTSSVGTRALVDPMEQGITTMGHSVPSRLRGRARVESWRKRPWFSHEFRSQHDRGPISGNSVGLQACQPIRSWSWAWSGRSNRRSSLRQSHRRGLGLPSGII